MFSKKIRHESTTLKIWKICPQKWIIPTLSDNPKDKIRAASNETWRSGYCYLKKGECNLNQSIDDSFVERVAKNNSWNNGDRHKIH